MTDLLQVALAASALGLALPSPPAATAAESPPPATPAIAAWALDARGRRFRVAFEPGHRVALGAAFEARGGGVAPGLDLALRLRSRPPEPEREVHWTGDHQVAHVLLTPASGRATPVEGFLYRGTFLRRSLQGTLTVPSTPPLVLPLPFDIGLAVELGRIEAAPPAPALASERPLEVGVVRAEILADFWRSARPGCWLALGVGGGYDLGLHTAPGPSAVDDQRVTPMSGLSVVGRAESRRGLLAGEVRIAAAERWSSLRGWEPVFEARAEGEAIPIAVNDLPISLLLQAAAFAGGERAAPELRALLALRVALPLR